MAIVGASDDVSRWGGSALQNIISGGFQGDIYPVNPRGGEFFGLPVYVSIEDVPVAPDLALLAVNGAQLGEALAQCGRRGARAAIAIAAGFSETGEAGEEAEQSLAEAAAAAGVTLIGPNCMGLIANASGLHATGSSRSIRAPASSASGAAIRQPRRAARRPGRPPRRGRALLCGRG